MFNKMPLGVYVGNPNGNDPAAEATFDNTLNSLSSTIGQTPQFLDTFADFSGSWSNMVASAGWNVWSQSKSPTAQNLTPVVAVGLGTKSDNGPGTLRAIAAGAHDDTYRGIAEAYRDAGYKTIDMRIGWEMNGNFMPWSMGNTTDSVNQWKAAFAHVADVVHGVSGMKVNVVWNPNASNNNQTDVKSAYPGDDKVDIIGLDIYSPTHKYDSSVSNSQYYNNPSASQYHANGEDPAQWGLAQTIALASEHGKPVGISETGIAVGDNTDLPGTIAADFSAPGAPQLAFVNVWDVWTGEGDWQFTDGHNPAAAKAWAAAFASGTSSAPASTASSSSTPSTSSTDTSANVPVTTQILSASPLVLQLSEDAYQGDAQFTVAVDGKTLGGAQTVSASHGAGAVQNFAFAQAMAAGTHDVAVSFLNDAWGGTAATDRNLYVDAIDANGAALPNTAAALMTTSTQHFFITVPAHA